MNKTILTTTSFVLGPNENLQNKLIDLNREYQALNKHMKISLNVLSETSDGCAPGCKMYFYQVLGEEK